MSPAVSSRSATPQRGQQRALPVARGTRATLLAGEGEEHLCLQSGQRTRANPSCRSAHLRNAAILVSVLDELSGFLFGVPRALTNEAPELVAFGVQVGTLTAPLTTPVGYVTAEEWSRDGDKQHRIDALSDEWKREGICHQNSGFPERSVRARNKCPSVVVTYSEHKSSSPNAQFVGR